MATLLAEDIIKQSIIILCGIMASARISIMLCLLLCILCSCVLPQSMSLLHGGEEEYCIVDVFDANCPFGEVIVMKTAYYGFMGKGRCIQNDQGINCSVDVLPLFEKKCSWKNECQYPVFDLEKENLNPCLSQIRPYLVVDYQCIAVETSDTCQPRSAVKVSGMSGSISSIVAEKTGCGSLTTPWTIKVLKGQSVSLTLAYYQNNGGTKVDTETSVCVPIGYISNVKSSENVTICESSNDRQSLYTSAGVSVKIQVLTNKPSLRNFIIEYSIVGCVDLLTPEFAWYERSGDDAIIGCKHRNMTWHLHCEGNRWNGVMGKCHDISRALDMPTNTNVSSQPDSYQFLILVCIIAAVFITLLVCITVAIFKLIDRRNAKQLAKQQILLDSSTSHRYSGGPQRHDPLMYHERIEMVPDILENSLRRTYAPGKADSESSSQTNYPGTLYFMGTLGHNVQSPVVEAIPLPRKPASVSDSESEHLYDSIPADCT